MKEEKSRQTTLKEFGLVFLITVLLAGCTIPTPDEVFAEPETCVKDWSMLNGTFTYLIDDANNSTYETVWLHVNSTHGFIEVDYFHYNLTHLSFTIVNNSVIFNNYSFDINGYLMQDGYIWSNGYAPNMGNVSLYFTDFPFDVTVDYQVKYRIWNGRECNQQ